MTQLLSKSDSRVTTSSVFTSSPAVASEVRELSQQHESRWLTFTTTSWQQQALNNIETMIQMSISCSCACFNTFQGDNDITDDLQVHM
jgi:hypothetical protein